MTDIELIVVDNGSTDHSVNVLEEVQQSLPFPLHVLPNSTNRGFGFATNQGIRRASAPWIATLNNDTRPEAEWMERLLSTTDSKSRVGSIGSKLLRANAPSQIDSAGIAMDWMGIAWDHQGGELDDTADDNVREIFGPCAGAALYSRAMLNEIGLFDGEFFAYLEDVDLSWRARLAGWQAVLQPQARVLHAHSSTLGHDSPRKRFLLARNKVWLLVKNYPTQDLARHLPGILLYDAAATLYGIAQKRDAISLRGRMTGLAKLPRFLGKRRRIQSKWDDVTNWRKAVSANVAPWSVSQRYQHLQQTRSSTSGQD